MAGLSSTGGNRQRTDDGPTRVTLWRLVVPLRHDHAASYGSSSARDVVLVELSTPDGVVGWGECPTFDVEGYATETTDEAWSALRDELVPAFLERSVSDGADDPIGSPPTAASAALDDARLDNGLRGLGLGLPMIIGSTPGPLERTVVLAAVGEDIAGVVGRAVDAVAGGAVMVKTKIAPGRDVDLVAALSDAIGPHRLAVDANGSYDSPAQLARLDTMGLAYIEQPFDPRLDWPTLGAMAGALTTPVALDESIRDTDDVGSAVSCGAARIVSVKPARVGGLILAAQMVERAAGLGLDVFVGGMVELGVGRAGALCIAAMTGCSLPTDLGPSEQYFELDVTAPLDTDLSGRVVVPSGPGTGRTPLPEMLERFCVDRTALV